MRKKLGSCAVLTAMGLLMVVTSSATPALAQFTTIAIDDHFDNGDLATGGVNGGFTQLSNGGGGGSASEAGTLATVVTTGGNDNSGIVSINSFDAAGQSMGFRMTFTIDSLSSDPLNNGMFLGLQDDGTSFYRNIDNFGLVFSGNESRTSSGGGFGLGITDNGSGGFANTFDDADLQLSSLLDGFMAEITATPDGWAYEITGVNDTGGSPTTFANSDTWINSGEAATFYADFFDNAEHIGVWTQRGGGGNPNITTQIDQVGVQFAAVPEPASIVIWTMIGMGLAGIGFRMRRRK